MQLWQQRKHEYSGAPQRGWRTPAPEEQKQGELKKEQESCDRWAAGSWCKPNQIGARTSEQPLSKQFSYSFSKLGEPVLVQDFSELSQRVFGVAEPNRWNTLPENTDMAQATDDGFLKKGDVKWLKKWEK